MATWYQTRINRTICFQQIAVWSNWCTTDLNTSRWEIFFVFSLYFESNETGTHKRSSSIWHVWIRLECMSAKCCFRYLALLSSLFLDVRRLVHVPSPVNIWSYNRVLRLNIIYLLRSFYLNFNWLFLWTAWYSIDTKKLPFKKTHYNWNNIEKIKINHQLSKRQSTFISGNFNAYFSHVNDILNGWMGYKFKCIFSKNSTSEKSSNTRVYYVFIIRWPTYFPILFTFYWYCGEVICEHKRRMNFLQLPGFNDIKEMRRIVLLLTTYSGFRSLFYR